MVSSLSLAPQRRVYAAFALYSLTLGGIFPRFADLRDAMQVGEGAFGRGLIGMPVGTLIALTVAPPLLERIGYRRALLAGLPLAAVCYALVAHSTSPAMMFALLVPAGLLLGCIEIIVNLEADRVEAKLGRRIMNRAHSFWSFGFFCAGLIGAAAAHLGLSAPMQLGLMVPVVAALVWALLGGFAPAAARAAVSTSAEPRFATPSLAIMTLVAVTLSAMLMEGAGLDWSAIYMRNVYGSSPFWAGFAVAMVALWQAAGRFFADRFVERHGAAQVARAMLWTLAAGVGLVVWAVSPALSLLGFGLMGLGTSVIFPLAMSAAAQRQDRGAAANVAALAQMSFVAFLAGPPLLGGVAEHWGAPMAFAVGLPLVAVSLLTVKALDPQPDAGRGTG